MCKEGDHSNVLKNQDMKNDTSSVDIKNSSKDDLKDLQLKLLRLKKESDGSVIQMNKMREQLECLSRRKKEKHVPELNGFSSAPAENRGKAK